MKVLCYVFFIVTVSAIQGISQSCNPCFEICDNGLDDNADGLTDCDDPLCQGDTRSFTLSGTPELIDDTQIIGLLDFREDEIHDLNSAMNVSTWTQNGRLRLARALINMPLDAVIDNAIDIDEAIVTLYGIEDFPSSLGGQFGDNAMRIQLVSDSWIEETTSWNTQPGIINGPEVVVPMNNDYDSINIDIAPLLNFIITNELPFNGIRLSQINESDPFRVMVFHSSNSLSTDLTPRITINYTDSFVQESCLEEIAPIPTLGEWALIILSLSLLILMTVYYKQSVTQNEVESFNIDY